MGKRGLLVSPQEKVQNLSGFQLVESNWAETTSDSRQPHHGYVCPGNYRSKYTPGFGRSKKNYTYWAYIPNSPLLKPIDWGDSMIPIYVNDSSREPGPEGTRLPFV